MKISKWQIGLGQFLAKKDRMARLSIWFKGIWVLGVFQSILQKQIRNKHI